MLYPDFGMYCRDSFGPRFKQTFSPFIFRNLARTEKRIWLSEANVQFRDEEFGVVFEFRERTLDEILRLLAYQTAMVARNKLNGLWTGERSVMMLTASSQ